MDREFADYLLRKTKEDYDQIADDFSATRAFPWAEMKQLADEYVQDGDRILDAGCGNGRMYELLKSKNIFYHGIDSSEKLIKIAKAKYGDYFETENLVDMSAFKTHDYSLVFCIATLQHIPSKTLRLQVLKNFHKALLPNSNLILINWNIINQAKFKQYLDKTALQKGFDPGDMLYPWKARKPEIVYRYYHGFSEKELENLLIETNFACEKQYYTKHGKETSPDKGYNLVTIARKK
ncbi:class I SAM-dependent methyltransferase [Patescibacteria group bacterium]